MAAPKRTDEEILRTRAEIARLYCMGWTHQRIADAVGMTRQMVTYDIEVIREGWRQIAIQQYAEHVAIQLARIDNLEAEAWGQYEISKGAPVTKTQFLKAPPRDPASGKVDPNVKPEVTNMIVRTDQGERGNPAYLGTIQWCIAERNRLLGLYAPIKTQNVVLTRGMLDTADTGNMADDELDAEIRRLESLDRRARLLLEAGTGPTYPATLDREDPAGDRPQTIDA